MGAIGDLSGARNLTRDLRAVHQLDGSQVVPPGMGRAVVPGFLPGGADMKKKNKHQTLDLKRITIRQLSVQQLTTPNGGHIIGGGETKAQGCDAF